MSPQNHPVIVLTDNNFCEKIMSNRMRVLVNDTLITVNTRHLIITRNTLSQKSREAIIYNKSCLQASFKIDVRLIKNKQYFFHSNIF